MTKRLLLFIALMCAFAQGVWAQNSWDEVYAMTQTTSANWTPINAGSTDGYVLGASNTTTYYYVNGNQSFINNKIDNLGNGNSTWRANSTGGFYRVGAGGGGGGRSGTNYNPDSGRDGAGYAVKRRRKNC